VRENYLKSLNNFFFFGLILFLLIPNSTLAFKIEKYEINFEVQPDMSIREIINITFAEPVWNETIYYKLEGDVFGVNVFADGKEMSYTYSKVDSATLISTHINKSIQRLQFIFLIKGIIFEYKDVKHFFSIIKIPSQTIIKLTLPTGYILSKNDFYPRNAQRYTDGRRIILVWRLNETGEIPLSVKFQPSFSSNQEQLILIVFLFSFSLFFLYFYFKKRIREVFLKGFDETERKIIEILEKEKIIFQNKLEKTLNISRVKVSRTVKKLENKGLVKKEKRGRTNKLIWLK